MFIFGILRLFRKFFISLEGSPFGFLMLLVTILGILTLRVLGLLIGFWEHWHCCEIEISPNKLIHSLKYFSPFQP